jgi:unsaturated rhamnogalacturonyl hydrolase
MVVPSREFGLPGYSGGGNVRDARYAGMKTSWVFFALLLSAFPAAEATHAGERQGVWTDTIASAGSWARRIADSFLQRHPEGVTYDTGFTEKKWNYEQGLMLWALCRMSQHTGEPGYYDFVEKNLDRYVEPDGRITSYRLADYNLDLIAPGRALLAVYRKSGQEKYRRAADTLRRQLREQPRTDEGGFWHKKIYPYQMWLDGLFMAGPFYAMNASLTNEPAAFDDIAGQFILIARRTRDAKTGLLYHGWDERRQQRWADSTTGCSPSFWGRAMGWYIMGLVDVLDYFPEQHPKRKELIAILNDVAAGLLKYRDRETGLWRLVLDQGKRPGNYFESSSACMFTYAFAKGAARGYLDTRYFGEAERSFKGILLHHVSIDRNGFVNLHDTIKGAGLGGKPYRDGTFEYYASEGRRTNDMKGVGPFLLAAIELEEGIACRKGEDR